MSLEIFVRASGAVMGLARDSFSLGQAGGSGSATGPLSTLTAAAVSGSGQAVSAFNNESGVMVGQLSALGEQDLAASSDLTSALAAAGAGHDQMQTVIAGAVGDINRLAAATTTPAGRQALLNALTLRLEQTWQTLTNGNADASTRAASSTQTAAAYSAVGTTSGTVAAPTAATTAAHSTSAASASTQNTAMSAATMAAANQAVLSEATQLASLQQLPTTAQPTTTNTTHTTLSHAATDSSQVKAVISRAMKELGVPYSWGGGGPSGPTYGLAGTSGQNTRGFDCSGLVQYAYWPYIHLPRDTYAQVDIGQRVSRSHIQAGDLIFSNFGEDGVPGPGHVQLAISSTQVVEAPHTGAYVQVSAIPTGQVVVKRILG